MHPILAVFLFVFLIVEFTIKNILMQFSFSWMIVIQRTNKNSDVDGEVIMGL